MNLVIAGGLAAVVATVSMPWALAVLAASTATIAVRGYLVPGTPTLTKRYLPDRVLAWFDKGPAAGSASGPTAADRPADSAAGAPLDAGRTLVDAGVLHEEPSLDDYVVDDAFRTEWTALTRDLLADDDDHVALAGFLDVDPDTVGTLDRGFAYVASLDGEWVGQWESREAFAADLAAATALDGRVTGWKTLPTARRSELLGSLRLFLEECPACGDAVSLGTAVVESCCREYDVLAATCVGCDARLFEADVDPAALVRLAESE